MNSFSKELSLVVHEFSKNIRLSFFQTGSGKTYTMGTAFDMMDVMNANDIGIVPRAIEHLFSGMEARKQQALDQGCVEPCFDIVAQFVEVIFPGYCGVCS